MTKPTLDVAGLRQSLAADTPPQGLAGPLLALWHAGRGEWHKAHAIIQDDESAAAAWVHAHLHRSEGDHGNAGYWYRRAGKPVSQAPIDDEWVELGSVLLRL